MPNENNNKIYLVGRWKDGEIWLQTRYFGWIPTGVLVTDDPVEAAIPKCLKEGECINGKKTNVLNPKTEF